MMDPYNLHALIEEVDDLLASEEAALAVTRIATEFGLDLFTVAEQDAENKADRA